MTSQTVTSALGSQTISYQTGPCDPWSPVLISLALEHVHAD
jgi:hypothetical protein